MAVAHPEPHPGKFSEVFKVTEDMIDYNGHMNNVVAAKWIQDITLDHANACGATEVANALNAGWMIRTQHIEYRAQAFLGDELEGTTWVPEYARSFTHRLCTFRRKTDGAEIFSSETTWVLIDRSKNRPMGIPEELMEKFRDKGGKTA